MEYFAKLLRKELFVDASYGNVEDIIKKLYGAEEIVAEKERRNSAEAHNQVLKAEENVASESNFLRQDFVPHR